MSPRENGDTGSARSSEGDDRGRKALLAAAKLAVSALVLWLLASRLDLSQTFGSLARSDKLLWFLAFLLVVASQVISSFRWGILLAPLGFTLPRGRVAGIYFIGMFFSLFLPSVIGGDAIKTYYAAGGWKKAPAAIYSLLADRGVGMAAMLAYGAAGLLLTRNALPPLLAWGFAAFILAIYVAFLFFPALSGPLIRLFRKMREIPRERLFVYWDEPGPAFRAYLLSLPVHLCLVAAHVLMAMALGLRVPWGAFMVVYPLTALASMIPVSLNGLGPREASYVFLLSLFGVSREGGGALAVMWLSLVVASGLLGAVPFLRFFWRGKREDAGG